MPLFAWDQSFSVSVRKLDEQHKALIGIVNQLFESISGGRGAEVIESTLNELVSYTKVHFREEEAMMRATNYPAFAIHQAQHTKFEETVQKLIADLRANGRANTVTLLQFLKDWLTTHIKQTDKQYSAFVNAKGYV
jgi:hemerythrin